MNGSIKNILHRIALQRGMAQIVVVTTLIGPVFVSVFFVMMLRSPQDRVFAAITVAIGALVMVFSYMLMPRLAGRLQSSQQKQFMLMLRTAQIVSPIAAIGLGIALYFNY